MGLSLGEAKFTVRDAYLYWAVLALFGHDFDESPIDVPEAEIAMIGWASRDQNELI